MKCDAEIAAERIQNNKTITDKDILELEVLRRRCISSCSHFDKILNIYKIRKKRDQDKRNDPTTNEQDKKAANLQKI